MALPEKQLFIKMSSLPGSGKGLFTKNHITKGTRIAEYKGTITTWKSVLQEEERTGIINKYLFYINRNCVIDAMHTKAKARYANDARGFTRIEGLINNCKYVIDKQRVFIEALRNIPAGDEILISYGKEYWHILKQTM